MSDRTCWTCSRSTAVEPDRRAAILALLLDLPDQGGKIRRQLFRHEQLVVVPVPRADHIGGAAVPGIRVVIDGGGARLRLALALIAGAAIAQPPFVIGGRVEADRAAIVLDDLQPVWRHRFDRAEFRGGDAELAFGLIELHPLAGGDRHLAAHRLEALRRDDLPGRLALRPPPPLLGPVQRLHLFVGAGIQEARPLTRRLRRHGLGARLVQRCRTRRSARDRHRL